MIPVQQIVKIKIILLKINICVLLIIGCKNKTEPITYDPPADANYTAEFIKISLDNGDILAGTLTVPKNANQPSPCFLLITGSSPHDRDNSKPTNPLTAYRPFRQIADLLSSNGLAVLRMDDRGIGSSKGGDINKITTPERANDIKQCIKYLKHRTDIDSNRIGLLGLSEGASIAHMIASKDSSVKILVLLSAPARSGRDIINYQINNGIIDCKKLPTLLRKDINLRYLYDFDPMVTARLVKQPVLIINGELDKNVPPDDGLILGDEMIKNGNLDVTVHIIKNLNHLLLIENKDSKIVSTKIPDETLSIIRDWVLKEI